MIGEVINCLLYKDPNQQNVNNIIAYTVKPGDTLFGISLTYNTNVWGLKQLNGMDEDNVVAGQTIQIEIQNTNSPQQKKIEYHKKIEKDDSIFRNKLFTIQFSIPIKYQTRNGDVKGLITISYGEIYFSSDRKKLKQTLIKNTKKKANQITDNQLDEYDFFIKQREVYKIEIKKDLVIIFIWGVVGINVPIYNDQDISLIKVTLKARSKSIKILNKLKIELNLMVDKKNNQPEEFIGYILSSIGQDRLNVTEDTLNFCVLPFLEVDMKPIQCESYTTFYEMVSFEQVRDLTLEIYKKPIQKLQSIPRLIPDNIESIVNQKLMKCLIDSLPQYLQLKDWHFVYSPSRNGTSYEELLRRTELVDHHFIIIRDESENLFGCFVTDSWRISKNKFFGSGESFLFSFKNKDFKLFRSSQKNQCYQMADDTGISIGAGDRYGLWINHELLRGNTFPCETFGNDILTCQNDFNILDLEIWCLKDDWQKTRQMNQVKSSLLNK